MGDEESAATTPGKPAQAEDAPNTATEQRQAEDEYFEEQPPEERPSHGRAQGDQADI